MAFPTTDASIGNIYFLFGIFHEVMNEILPAETGHETKKPSSPSEREMIEKQNLKVTLPNIEYCEE
ncbi:MAG: hypothetical protein AABZ32_09375 [Bacteroidota bacterium]